MNALEHAARVLTDAPHNCGYRPVVVGCLTEHQLHCGAPPRAGISLLNTGRALACVGVTAAAHPQAALAGASLPCQDRPYMSADVGRSGAASAVAGLASAVGLSD
jgi:hypothetical protein